VLPDDPPLELLPLDEPPDVPPLELLLPEDPPDVPPPDEFPPPHAVSPKTTALNSATAIQSLWLFILCSPA